MRKSLIVVPVVLSIFSVSFGLTLDEAVDRAIQDNPALAGFLYQWEAAKEEKTRVSSLPDPAIEFAFGQSGADFDGDLQTIGISQKIPFPAKITTSRARAEAMGLAAEARFLNEQLKIVNRVKHAYADLLLVDEMIGIYREDLSDARLLEDAIRRRYEVGKATQHDLIKAQIEAHLVENQIDILEGDNRVRETARLRTLLNMDHDESFGDLQKPRIDFAEIDAAAIKMGGVTDSPELQASDQQIKLADRDVSLAKMEWIPDLMLRFFRDERDMMMGRNKARGVMVSLNVPLWWWSNGAEVGKKKSLVYRARAEREATEDALALGLEERVASFTAARGSYVLFRDVIIPEAELAYTSAQVGYEMGEIDVLSLISAQRSLREARLSQLRLWTKLAKDVAEIERLTGLALY
jgi:cobalt-zinc-cadmium efflux system outer membrane protein